MARLPGHRQTKGTETDKPNLRLQRHISTLHPSPAASKPSRRPAHCRAAIKPTRLAIVALLVIAPDHCAGSPKSCLSQHRTTSLVCTAAGLLAHKPAFRSIAAASQSPASTAGATPLVTKPKKRGPGDAGCHTRHAGKTPASTRFFDHPAEACLYWPGVVPVQAGEKRELLG